jgi:3-oxoacyl-[acyl-carrier protein] reductase
MNGRVLITGAAGALGRSVVTRCLDAGERVLAVDANEGALAGLSALAPPDRLEARKTDLTSSEDVERLFAETAGAAGIQTVLHLVGGFRWSRIADMSDQDWSFLLALNLETTFRIFRAAARRFEAVRGGSLVAVAAPAGLLG